MTPAGSRPGTPPGSGPGSGPDAGRLWPAILIGWSIASAVLVLLAARDIAQLWFPDPDDAMRMAQVRDWIAGQSWWDVDQHRLNGGVFSMHWSRLVDLPLAAMLVGLTPVLGPFVADRVTVTVVPLITLLVVMALAAYLTRRLAGQDRAKLAVLLTPLSIPLLYQLRPLRIDHHGWQIAFALAAVAALIGTAQRNARSGIFAGAALAGLLTVSLEGLPVTVAIVAVALLAWAIDPVRRAQALGLVLTLLIGVVLLHVLTRGPGMFMPACDAIAPGWIAALSVATGSAVSAMSMRLRSVAPRMIGLGIAGGAALATLLTLTPECTRGPFATLDPLVYRLWYQNVSEGLPIWQQTPAIALITIGFPIIGLFGGALAWRASAGEQRTRWMMLIAIGFAAFVLSLLVNRTGATANALALPGGAWLLHIMLIRARAIPTAAKRVVATAAAFVIATPGLAASALLGAPGARPVESTGPSAPSRPSCTRGHEIASLSHLPDAIVFTPLEAAPGLLAWTGHRAIASGYHRNTRAINRVLATFLADPVAAQASIRASGATYVAGCPGESETELYKNVAPEGFWAQLERGERFDWLVPVDSGSPALAWRVVTPLPTTPPRP